MILGSILIQTGVFGLVLSGVMLLFRVLEDVASLNDFQVFLRSGWGLFLIVGLAIYGTFGIIFGSYKLFMVFKND